MSNEDQIYSLRARIADLEQRLKLIYRHLGIEYVEDQAAADARIIELLKKGNKIEAIKVYRQIHGVGLAEAKSAVDDLDVRLGN